MPIVYKIWKMDLKNKKNTIDFYYCIRTANMFRSLFVLYMSRIERPSFAKHLFRKTFLSSFRYIRFMKINIFDFCEMWPERRLKWIWQVFWYQSIFSRLLVWLDWQPYMDGLKATEPPKLKTMLMRDDAQRRKECHY